MGIVFFRIYTLTYMCVCVDAHVRVFASRSRHFSTSFRTCAGVYDPDFQFFAASKFFLREFICWRRNERSRRAFSRGANFAAVCIRHYEARGNPRCISARTPKGTAQVNGTMPLIMHRRAKWRTINASVLNFAEMKV